MSVDASLVKTHPRLVHLAELLECLLQAAVVRAASRQDA
jgi:hypothetical protein